MNRFALAVFVTALGVVAATPAAAVVTDRSASGFTSYHAVAIEAPPEVVYRSLTRYVAEWWDPAQTVTGDADNVSLTVRPGGCLCETLPGGGFQVYMGVVKAVPDRELRLRGPHWPLQGMGVNGAMTFELADDGAGGTTLSLTFQVGGYGGNWFEGAAEQLDPALGEQLTRLRDHAEVARIEGRHYRQ